MPRYLVIVDYPGSSGGPPIAGIYVTADSRREAEGQVRMLLSEAKLTTYLRPPNG